MSKSESETNNPSLPIGLNLFDKAWEFMWVLGFMYLILFIDISSLILFDKGIFHWTFSNIPTLSFGHIGIVIISFGFFSALFLPAITLVFNLMLISFYYKFFYQEKLDRNRALYNYVRINQLRDYALNNNSDFLYQIYLSENKKNKKKQAKQLKLENISFGIFLFFLFDWWLSSSNGESKSVVDYIWNTVIHFDENVSHGLVGFLVSILVFFFSYFVCLPRETDSYVYYPPLYNEIEKERKKVKEQQRKFKQEVEEQIAKNKKDKGYDY